MASSTTHYGWRWSAPTEEFSPRPTDKKPPPVAGSSVCENVDLDASASRFGLLPDPQPRTRAFGMGLIITSSILVIMCLVPLLVRPAMVESAAKYVFVELTAPPIVPPTPAPQVAKAAAVPATVVLKVPSSPAKIMAEAVVAPPIAAFMPQLPQTKYVAPAHVQTNVFVSTGSSAPATTATPRS